MRSRFDEELERLHQELMEMGNLCETAITGAAAALSEGNQGMLALVEHTEIEIDQKERDIEDLCLKLLLRQQPVAKDLRQISSALKMITDMERIGDQASDIAEIIMTAPVLSRDESIVKMARATRKMVSESIQAFVGRDLKMAQAVMEYDDVVDRLFDAVKNDLIEQIGQGNANGEAALDLLMIAKYFERIGDHAENIAEWVEFSITGRHRNSEHP